MALLTPNDRVNNPKSAASCLRCSDLLLSPKRLVAQMTVDRRGEWLNKRRLWT